MAKNGFISYSSGTAAAVPVATRATTAASIGGTASKDVSTSR